MTALHWAFIIDMPVFLGVRSFENSRLWVSSDQNVLLHPSIGFSMEGVCEQMSVPLSYDDGINLRPRKCSNVEAYVACAIRCEYVHFIDAFFYVLVG